MNSEADKFRWNEHRELDSNFLKLLGDSLLDLRVGKSGRGIKAGTGIITLYQNIKAKFVSCLRVAVGFLSTKEKCSKCGHEKKTEVIAWFKKPVRLTIFEAEMLFAVFGLGRRPLDYANYHKCPAGKEFVESIDDIGKNVMA
jgi:hypothetical protein